MGRVWSAVTGWITQVAVIAMSWITSAGIWPYLIGMFAVVSMYRFLLAPVFGGSADNGKAYEGKYVDKDPSNRPLFGGRKGRFSK